MWLEILHSVAESFRVYPDLTGFDVIEGSPSAIEKYPTIEVLRDNENGILLHGSKNGTVTINIQPWIRNDDPDPYVGYVELSKAENTVLDCLDEWAKTPKNGYAVRVTVKTIVGDGDAFRPVCGSRIPLEISWKKV